MKSSYDIIITIILFNICLFHRFNKHNITLLLYLLFNLLCF
eukprot:UN03125